MTPRALAVLAAVLVLVSAALAVPPAGPATFGAAVFTPVAGSPLAAPHVIGLAPVPGAWAVTLTRTVDSQSALLARAQASVTHFRKVGIAWQGPGGVRSLCFSDASVASHSTRQPPGGGPPIEHSTLLFAAVLGAGGPDACRTAPPPPSVVVRLFTEPVAGGLRARVDCLLVRCAGSLRLLCPTEGCPRAGLSLGAFALSAGQERLLPVRIGRKVRGRHPKVTAVIRLSGRPAPIVVPLVVDSPPPAALPTVTSGTSGASTSPLPAGGAFVPPGAGSGTATGPAPAAPGGGGPAGDQPPGASGPVDTSLTLSCDGAPGHLTGVHGTLAPALAGRVVEVDYLPVDPAARTVIHQVTTGPGGSFTDPAGAPFARALAVYAGGGVYLPSSASCPP
jgi:hypothetical protein